MNNETLRNLVDKSDKSQKEIAEALGLSQQRFNYYVNGQREPDYDTLIKIADYFEVSLDYLLRQPADIGGKTIYQIALDIPLDIHEDRYYLTPSEIIDTLKFFGFSHKQTQVALKLLKPHSNASQLDSLVDTFFSTDKAGQKRLLASANSISQSNEMNRNMYEELLSVFSQLNDLGKSELISYCSYLISKKEYINPPAETESKIG